MPTPASSTPPSPAPPFPYCRVTILLPTGTAPPFVRRWRPSCIPARGENHDQIRRGPAGLSGPRSGGQAPPGDFSALPGRTRHHISPHRPLFLCAPPEVSGPAGKPVEPDVDGD